MDENGDTLDIRAMLEQHLMAVKRAQVVRHLGWSVTRIVNRIDSMTDGNLDLSQCQLVQLPDAVYFLMRHTPVVSCNLSSNVLTKIPPKLASNFASLKHLDLSHNKLSSLPANIGQMAELESIDISNNILTEIPDCLLNAPQIKTVIASNNHIRDLDIDAVSKAKRLDKLDIRNNPLGKSVQSQLAAVAKSMKVDVITSQQQTEEWEDLDI